MSAPLVDVDRQTLAQSLGRLKQSLETKQRHAELARTVALPRLIEAMRCKTGQSYRIRALLYSLWNGKPASLLDIVELDYDLRSAMVCVLMGFGYEPSTLHDVGEAFFYDALSDALTSAELFDWFVEAREDQP